MAVARVPVRPAVVLRASVGERTPRADETKSDGGPVSSFQGGPAIRHWHVTEVRAGAVPGLAGGGRPRGVRGDVAPVAPSPSSPRFPSPRSTAAGMTGGGSTRLDFVRSRRVARRDMMAA